VVVSASDREKGEGEVSRREGGEKRREGREKRGRGGMEKEGPGKRDEPEATGLVGDIREGMDKRGAKFI
jgi:hypothetical protein